MAIAEKAFLMLENWLSPADWLALGAEHWAEHQLGRQVLPYSGGAAWPKAAVAILGIQPKPADAIRKALYTLASPIEGLQVVDLGNFRNPSPAFIIPALTELFQAGLVPILIGGDTEHFVAQYKAAQQHLSLVSLAVVDEQLRIGTPAKLANSGDWDDLFLTKANQLFHFTAIGVQAHFIPGAQFRFLEQRYFDCIRLGQARANLMDVEAAVRDCDLIGLHVAALKQAEAPGQVNATPSGFTVEEACQICRYAGISDKLTGFGLFGYSPSLDRKAQTAQVMAQMVWYFLDGYFNRKGDFPASTDGLVEYIVDSKKLAYQLVFWKSQKSGRWWIQVPVKTRKKLQRHRLIPCTYQDYKQACQEELPDRLINAFRRFL